MALAAVVWSAAAVATPDADFSALLADHWAWWLDQRPVAATTLGERDPARDARLSDLSLEAMDRSAADATQFRARLSAIPRSGLSPDNRLSADILDRILAEQVADNRHKARARLFTTYAGFHTGFSSLPGRLPFFTTADFESYAARLEAFGPQVDQAIITTRVAIADDQVLPCAVLDGFETAIRGNVAPAAQSRFLAPFSSRPAAITEADWSALKARATRAVETSVNPGYTRFADFFAAEYRPACAKEVGIAARPGGRDYYVHRARTETTTDLTPDQIHRIGLDEVARIRAEMGKVAKAAGFATREAYIAHLRSDPQFYATTPEALMAEASRQAKIADGWMPRLFGKLPRLPYGLAEIPAHIAPGTTTAYYMPGSATSGQAGTYFVNTSKLNERPLFELPALTIHEAVPGHHHQIALQQELDLPKFRRHGASFTAYTEGWGLYSERLGIEMGMYDTPARDMGRLSYEMWRATRLVVDTGMHWKGWTKQQAIDFMLDNTALSAANIEAEVNRYISWPGQALGYKIGEIRIRALRAEAERALGPRFDLRAFHDTILESGSIPLDLLEQRVRAWIASQR